MIKRPSVILVILICLAVIAGRKLQDRQQRGKTTAGASASSVADSTPPQESASMVAKYDSRITALEMQVQRLSNELTSLQAQLGEQNRAQSSDETAPRNTEESAPALRKPLADMAEQIVELRGIEDSTPNIIEVERVEVGERIAGWLSSQYSPEQGELQGRALAALGAITEPVDTILIKAGFWAFQIGGWYSHDDNLLYLADGSDAVFPTKENALALSYGALFKQYGKLLFPPNREVVTLDEQIAKNSLLCGDAAFTRFQHTLDDSVNGGGGGVGDDPEDPSRALPVPNFLREIELLPYTAGLQHVQFLYEQDGWASVNAAYQTFPTSSAHLKTLERRSPTPIPSLEQGAKIQQKQPFWIDRLGPLATAVFLSQHVIDTALRDISAGWRDDQLLAYEAAGSARPHAVWHTRWHDADAATLFFNTAKESLSSRYKNAAPLKQLSSTAVHLNTGDRQVIIALNKDTNSVLYIDAADDAFASSAHHEFAQLTPLSGEASDTQETNKN